jgi:hypothetical protein
MPAFVYLSQSEVDKYSQVKDDKLCNDLLQEMRNLSGLNWLISVDTRRGYLTWWQRVRGVENVWLEYTLYADCSGEYQVINLAGPEGGSVFHSNRDSRSAVLNFMMGFLDGWRCAKREEKNDYK